LARAKLVGGMKPPVDIEIGVLLMKLPLNDRSW
jgi:hypothetical protein